MQARELTKIPVLIGRLKALEKELERLKTKKNSNNSSLPPLKNESRLSHTSSLRAKGSRKAGGHPGHEGKILEMTSEPDEIIEYCSCFFPECGKDVSNQLFELFCKE